MCQRRLHCYVAIDNPHVWWRRSAFVERWMDERSLACRKGSDDLPPIRTDAHLSPMRTHRSLKRRGLPWPRWALRSRLCRPNSSSWLRLSGSNMWGSSSSPRPGMFSGSCSSSSASGEPVTQLVGVTSVGSSVDPAVGSSAGRLLQTEEKQRVWFNTSMIRPFQFTPQAKESLKPLSSVCFVS